MAFLGAGKCFGFSPVNSAAVADLGGIFIGAGGAGDSAGLLHCLDAVPGIRYLLVGIDGAALVIQQEATGLAMLGVAATPVHRDDDEAEGFQFAQGCRGPMPVNTVFDELFFGYDELAVGLAGVVAQLNLDAQQGQMCGTGEDA